MLCYFRCCDLQSMARETPCPIVVRHLQLLTVSRGPLWLTAQLTAAERGNISGVFAARALHRLLGYWARLGASVTKRCTHS